MAHSRLVKLVRDRVGEKVSPSEVIYEPILARDQAIKELRKKLIEVAVAEQTKKIIEFPSTQYTESNVGNLCESLRALEISKRIDREAKEGENG